MIYLFLGINTMSNISFETSIASNNNFDASEPEHFNEACSEYNESVEIYLNFDLSNSVTLGAKTVGLLTNKDQKSLVESLDNISTYQANCNVSINSNTNSNEEYIQSDSNNTNLPTGDNHYKMLYDKNAMLNFFSNYQDDLKTYFILNNLLTNPDNKNAIISFTLNNIKLLICDKSTECLTRQNLIKLAQSIILNENIDFDIRFEALKMLESLLVNNKSCLNPEAYLELTDYISLVQIKPRTHSDLKEKAQKILKLQKVASEIRKQSLYIINEKTSLDSFKKHNIQAVKSSTSKFFINSISTNPFSFHDYLNDEEIAEINRLMSSLASLPFDNQIDVLNMIICEIRIHKFLVYFDFLPNLAKYITVLNNVKNAVIEEQKLNQELINHKSFIGFIKEDLWKLFIDGRYHKVRGKYGYEDESGYLAGCFCGFRHVLEDIRKKSPLSFETVNVDTLNEWRYHAVKNVLNEDFSSFHISLSLGCTFYFVGDKLSESGKEEMLASAKIKSKKKYVRLPGAEEVVIKRYANEFYHLYEEYQNEKPFKLIRSGCRHNNTTIADLKISMNKVLQKFFQELSISVSESDKERVIIKCVITLNRMHGFADGNIRTLVFLFLNGLMISHGMCPLIWENPNIIDGHSADESHKYLIAAKKRFRSSCIKPKI